MRLFTSNFRPKLILGILLLSTTISVLIVEYIYTILEVPYYIGKDHETLFLEAKEAEKPVLFILGDSRAESGVVPELIDSMNDFSSYNIGLDGVYKGYYYGLLDNNVIPDQLIVAVSPHSIFNNFILDYNKTNRLIKKKLLIFKSPYKVSEKILSGIMNKNSHLHYGFSAISDLFNYGKVSDFYSFRGWHGYDRLGSDEYYTSMINLYSYKYKMLEEYKDSSKVHIGMENFQRLVNDFQNRNIDVVFIRIPTSNEIRIIEEEKYPWFSDFIKGSVEKHNYKYIEFRNFEYPVEQVDGSHLNRQSAMVFTLELMNYLE